MLKLKNVSKYYYQDGVIASGINKVNLELFLGEFVVITGESGSGKSTLLNVLSGLDTYEDGEMYINGEETSHYTEKDYLEYRKKYVSNIFQNFNLVNSYTVYQNIELAMLMNGCNKKDIKKKVNELINKVGLQKYRNTRASKLSGGQKQRVAIARALAYETPIIVCDEPTGALDSKASTSILELLHEVSKDKLVIVVTHNKSEILKYATRLIRMHDGNILENRVVKEVNLDNQIEIKEVKNINYLSRIRLGIRNTFNLVAKFCLMIAIFLLIVISLISNYGSMKNSEYEESVNAYSEYFQNNSDLRIIFNKQDKSIISEEEYAKIKEIESNDYILFISSDNIFIDGSIYTKSLTKVDKGRLPDNDNEIVLIVNKNNEYINYVNDELFNTEFRMEKIDDPIKIVGIYYSDEYNDYSYGLYLNNDLNKKVLNTMYEEYIKSSAKLNDKILNTYYEIKINYNLKENEAYIKDINNGYCKNYNCQNKDLVISTSSIYGTKELNLNIKSVYDKNNAKRLLDENYDEIDNVIYISEIDYNKLFNLSNYQGSVFVKDIKDLNEVEKSLKSMNFNTLKLRDAKVNSLAIFEQIYKIIKLIVTIILIATLFFITYFIIKIIYKSRNSYFATLRSLGASLKDCVSILRNEIITFATISYLFIITLITLANKNIIIIKYFTDMTKYLNIGEYLLVYLILIILAILISYRYGRKIFSTSIMKNYGERI